MQINTGSSLNKILVLLIGLVVIFSACSSKDGVPKNIISLERMKVIMWDMAQADAFATQSTASDTTNTAKQKSLIIYQKVFALHKITKEKFIESIQFYESHPETHKVLLDSLIQYGTRMRDSSQIKKFKKPVLILADSLQKVAN